MFFFQEDGWDTEPFVLTEVDGKLFGRGSTDDKVGTCSNRPPDYCTQWKLMRSKILA